MRGIVPAILGAVALLSLAAPARAQVEPPSPAPWHEHHLRRALLHLAENDTLAALEQLERARDFDAPATLADRTALLEAESRWKLGLPSAPSTFGENGVARWARFLSLLQQLELGGAPATTSLDGPAAALVLAALELDAGSHRAARARLEKSDLPGSLHALRDHLLATTCERLGDDAAARTVWRRLAERDANERDRELVAEARMSLARLAAAAGEDPRPWLEGVPEASAHRARAELMLLVATADETKRSDFEAWLARHAQHPAAHEARLHAAALALDAGEWDAALEHYRHLDEAQGAQRERLQAAMADSLGALDAARWSEHRHFALDRGNVAERLRPFAAAARKLEGELPGGDRDAEVEALRLASIDAQIDEDPARPRLDARELRIDRTFGAAERDTTLAARRTARRERELGEQLARARAYRDVGAGRNETVSLRLHGAAGALDSLRLRLDGVVAHLHAARDTSLARIARRTERLLRLAGENRRTVRGLQTLYVDGPMARRERQMRADVPTPAQLLEREDGLSEGIEGFLVRFRDGAPVLVRRSFAEIFEPRLVDDSRALAEEAAWQIAWSDSIGEGIALARAEAESSPEWESAQARLHALRTELAANQEAWLAHRREATRRAREAALARLDARQEAVDYGLAMVHYQRGLGDDENAGSATLASRNEALRRMQAFLQDHPESRVRGDVRYRLADVHLMAARADFQRRMGAFLAEGESGASRALAPLLDYGPALELYEAILAEDLDFPRRDAVLFHLGMIHADLGDENAEGYLATLVRDHPDSELWQEAQLRLGDIAFERKDFATALPHFAAAADGAALEPRAVSLYKLGWSAYALDRNREAIDAFRRLLDVYASEEGATLSFDLADETEDLLIHAFARSGGAETFVEVFDAVGGRDYEPRILTGLSQLLGEYALHEEAEAADRIFLERFAHSPRALEAAQRLIASKERFGGVEAGDAARLDVFDRFRLGGDWAQTQASDSLRVAGDAFARDALRTVALRRHQVAREDENRETWREAGQFYAQLLQHWPRDAEAPRWNYLAGECARERKEWSRALELFAAAAASDSASFAGEAAWQRVAVADAWYRSTVDSTTSTAGEDSLARALLAVGDEYLVRPVDTERAADLRWRQAAVAVNHEWNEEAARRFESFATAHPRDPRALRAGQLRAEAFYRDERFEAAGAAFESAWQRANTAGADSLAAELATWIPHSYYRHAEVVTADSTRGLKEAAPLWMRVADRWPEFESADRALYQAGLGWQAQGSSEQAHLAWERLLDRYPESTLAADTHRAIAHDLEKREGWTEAAGAWERYAQRFPDEVDANESLLHAAELLEKSGASGERERVLDVYLAKNPQDVETRAWVLDGRARAELDAVEAGDVSLAQVLAPAAGSNSAVRGLLDLAQTHPDKVSPGLRARVDFLRAEQLRHGYEAMALTQPLKESVERKRDALTPLLEAYGTCAQHAVAPWAQAAAFRIGEALVHFGDALVESERPAGLEGDDLLAYDEVLEEQAYGFFDRGEEAWKELLVQGESDDAQVASWQQRARESLFPRVARRFLHQPAFEYPVLGAQAPQAAR